LGLSEPPWCSQHEQDPQSYQEGITSHKRRSIAKIHQKKYKSQIQEIRMKSQEIKEENQEVCQIKNEASKKHHKIQDWGHQARRVVILIVLSLWTGFKYPCRGNSLTCVIVWVSLSPSYNMRDRAVQCLSMVLVFLGIILELISRKRDRAKVLN